MLMDLVEYALTAVAVLTLIGYLPVVWAKSDATCELRRRPHSRERQRRMQWLNNAETNLSLVIIGCFAIGWFLITLIGHQMIPLKFAHGSYVVNAFYVNAACLLVGYVATVHCRNRRCKSG